MWETYYSPQSLDEALNLLVEYGQAACLVAGATDLLVELKHGQRTGVRFLIDLSRIPGLDRISLDEDGWIHLGPLVTHNDCITSSLIVERTFALASACWQVGSPQIRNRGTIAGNLITASPANDTITPLIALGARVTLRSISNARTVSLADLYKGVRHTILRDDEILTDISFPANNGLSTFLKLGLRRSQAISVVNTAVVLEMDGARVNRVVITLGAVAPTIVHAIEAEAYLRGKILSEETIKEAGKLATRSARPIDDIRSTARYRLEMVQVLVARALRVLATHQERKNYPVSPVCLRDPGALHQKQPWQISLVHTAETPIETTINGKQYTFNAGQGATLLDLLRETAGLTGAKEGCAEGECGACTVLLDGMAVMGCLVPAPRAHGAEIVTVEGLAQDGELNPLQEAFASKGAVQCGACTPGMLMSSTALLREKPNPTHEDVLWALSGNLCRCTGYSKIADAVLAASSKCGETTLPSEERDAKEHIIGRSLAGINVVSKVMGSAQYAADIKIPGMLIGLTLRSPHPHARILHIDITEAQALKGVKAIVTAADVPGTNRHGFVVQDQQVLAENEVRYVGEPIALVAAESREDAVAALKAIRVDYQPLPAVFDPELAVLNDQPLVSERGRRIPAGRIRKGNTEYGFWLAHTIVEDVYRTQEVEHAYLETDAAVAAFESNGSITVWASTQNPHGNRDIIASILNLPFNKVRVIQTITGGGFGGKTEIPPLHHAALLAFKTKSPVRIVYDREESMVATSKRIPYIIRSKVGAAKTGELVAAEIEILGDVGAYTTQGPALLARALVHCAGPYRIPNIKADGFYTFTNKVPIGGMRGYGTPQVFFAIEQQMNRLAHALQMSPLEIRRLNALTQGDETITLQRLDYSVGLRATIEAAAQAMDWHVNDQKSE